LIKSANCSLTIAEIRFQQPMMTTTKVHHL